MRRFGYTLLAAAFYVCAGVGWGLLLWAELIAAADTPPYAVVLVGAAGAAAALLLRVDLFLHELGHLLFGVLAGLKVRRACIGMFSFGQGGVRFGRRAVAGETQFSLRSTKGAHARLFAAAVGGSVFALAFGGTMLALYFVLPSHPALFFFTQLGVCCLPLALTELLPAELAAGKTDGLVLKELIRRTGETELSVRVMLAQLYARDMSLKDVPKELLFEVPVVREDSPAFAGLLRLQADYLHAYGDEAGERTIRARLQAIADEDGEPEKEA